jgi:hypothetical protein
MLYRGSCHCGRVAFEVEGELTGAVACNCSICSRRGSLLWCVPRESLRLLTSDGRLSTYTFSKHAIAHRFCPTCGIHPFAEDVEPQGDRMAYVDIRCLEGLTLAAVPTQAFDGRSM